MTPTDAVAHYVDQHPEVGYFCVAYSGGVDSHLLLALMVRLRDTRRSFNVRAVHVDHSMQLESASWAEHARKVCESLRVPLEVCRCTVEADARGPEASARRARYLEFDNVLQKGEHLLLAQHAEDQAETFLLQALRGSGPDGLAGIPGKRSFGKGMMARPLLSCSQQSLLNEAHCMGLDWVEDPSNQQLHLDRNFLRLRVMPMIKARWPAATQTLSRSAMRSAAASQALKGMAQQDLDGVKVAGKPELRLSALKKLPKERAFTAIRLWVRQRGLLMPRLQDLMQVHSDLINARHDSNGIVNVREYEFRRHRDSLYLLLPQAKHHAFRYTWNAPFADLFIAETGTTITLGECFRQGIRLPEKGGVVVKSRAGGELIRVGNPAFHKSVKKILQESSVPPWQRESIPLIYIDGSLAAVWQLAVAVEYKRKVSVGNVVERATAQDKGKAPLSDNAGAAAEL
ncbi:MAG: tRNA lysidine(34) synthetase TilS [Granulosicoccus sp.]